MSTINRFLGYWGKNIAAARERHEMTVFIAFLVLQVIFFVLKTGGIEAAGESECLKISELISIVCVCVWFFMWLPFKRHEKLQSQLDDRAEQKKTNDALGGYLDWLQNRLEQAKQVNRFSFEGDKEKQEWEESAKIISAIESILLKTLGHAECVMFKGAKPKPLADPEKPDIFTPRFQNWQWHVNSLTAKQEELKRIIERRLASQLSKPQHDM